MSRKQIRFLMLVTFSKLPFFFFIIKIQVLSPLLSTYAPEKWNFAFSHYHFSKIQQLLLMLLVKPAIYCI